MRSSEYHSAALVVVIVLALGFVLGRCVSEPVYRQIITEKKVPIEIRIPTLVIDKQVDTVRIVNNTADSTEINRLIAVRDSLRKELVRRSVGVLFGLDTITPLRDTIQIDCDEIQRRVTARIRFAVRDTTIVYLDTNTILPVQRSKWNLSAGLGAAFALENSVTTVRPAVFIGLSYSIFNF